MVRVFLARYKILLVFVAISACDSEPPNFVERKLPDLHHMDVIKEPRPQQTSRQVTSQFSSHTIDFHDLLVDLNNEFVDGFLSLQRQYHEKSQTQRQIALPVVEQSFEQGVPAENKEENFRQNTEKLLDILVVVDNSKSMEEEQLNLSEKLQPLLSFVEGSNWQIAITTTDPADRCLLDLIINDEDELEERFRTAVQAGTSGNNVERGVLTAARAIEDNCRFNNKPWLRPLSTLAIIVVSDEDNCSNGTECQNKPYKDAQYLLDRMAAVRTPGEDARVYGLLWHPSQPKSECSTALNQAAVYSELIAATKGTWGSICDEDYSETLAEVSKNLAVNLQRKFVLQNQPDPHSLRVFVDGIEVVAGFQVINNIVSFTTPPRNGAAVKITYRHGGTPVLRHFPLRDTPSGDSLMVRINEEPLAASAYTLEGSMVVFAEAPPPGAKVTIVYKKLAGLKKQFDLGEGFRPGSLLVSVNGRAIDDFRADPALGEVIFNQAPEENAEVIFEYSVAGAAFLSYPFGVDDEDLATLRCFDAETGDTVDFTYDNGMVVLPRAEFSEGRQLVLRYANRHRNQFSVSLPHEPLVDTLVASDGAVECREGLVLDGYTVHSGDCGFPTDISRVAFRYEYVSTAANRFTIVLPGWKRWQAQKWQVWVNDVLTEDYDRQDRTIIFPTHLPFRSVVRIQVDY